ncbi:dihydroxyacetone kinase subunit DhaL [Staphylococcus pettenkoferi]|uniref:dihydroxyacetone kinase subunit DhaL n=1 Tax=Staphylococcus pettenkoferi TaxID=170573 RepID=UPI0011AAC4C6|nr:dihydroxyacetone kinase subunit DhaL [Staphylococcus pettenkoferi]
MELVEMKERLLQLAETFAEQEAHLTELDREIGDGDHGVNMLRGFKALPDQIDDSSMAQLFKSTGMTLMSQIGGASGPLYGFSFVKMAQVVDEDFSKEQLPNVLETFAEAVAQRGKVERGEKTMFDVIDRAREAIANGERVTLEVLQGYAQDTVDLEATKGRAAYFKEDSIGHMDPGAQSSVYILNALIGEV